MHQLYTGIYDMGISIDALLPALPIELRHDNINEEEIKGLEPFHLIFWRNFVYPFKIAVCAISVWMTQN